MNGEGLHDITQAELQVAADQLRNLHKSTEETEAIITGASEVAESFVTKETGDKDALVEVMQQDNETGRRAAVMGLRAAVRAARRTPRADRTPAQRELLHDQIVHLSQRAHRPR
jgi:hypothetical protein